MPNSDEPKVIPFPAERGQRRALQPTPTSTANADGPVFLTPEELAELLKLPSVQTVYQWRRKRTGPPGFRAGRHVRYNLAAVLVWTEQTAEAA